MKDAGSLCCQHLWYGVISRKIGINELLMEFGLFGVTRRHLWKMYQPPLAQKDEEIKGMKKTRILL